MAYELGRPFVTISVLPDEDSYGRVEHAPPRGDWFHPDVKIDTRTRRYIEEHVMVILAGAETEEHWTRRHDDVPDDWRALANVGAKHDMSVAVDLASYVSGSAEETSAYITWLRQRVLNYVGRLDADVPDGEDSPMSHRRKLGDPRFWALVDALSWKCSGRGS
jgi:hypothetical protein